MVRGLISHKLLQEKKDHGSYSFYSLLPYNDPILLTDSYFMSNFTYKWAFFSHLTCCECQMPGLPLLSWKMIARLWYWRTHDSVILTKLRALLVQVTTLDFILLWNFNYRAYHHLLQIKAIQYRKQKWPWNKMLSNTITIYKCHWCTQILFIYSSMSFQWHSGCCPSSIR